MARRSWSGETRRGATLTRSSTTHRSGGNSRRARPVAAFIAGAGSNSTKPGHRVDAARQKQPASELVLVVSVHYYNKPMQAEHYAHFPGNRQFDTLPHHLQYSSLAPPSVRDVPTTLSAPLAEIVAFHRLRMVPAYHASMRLRSLLPQGFDCCRR